MAAKSSSLKAGVALRSIPARKDAPPNKKKWETANAIRELRTAKIASPKKSEHDISIVVGLRAASGFTPAPGVEVAFSVKEGGGKVNGADSVSVPSGPYGVAKVTWKLGDKAGVNRATATVPSLGAGRSVVHTFTMEAV